MPKTVRGTEAVKADWSRRLPRPIVIPDVMTLSTLADVRTLIEKHLPARLRTKTTWRHVAAKLKEAAQGASTAEVAVPLLMVLAMEGVECRLR
jgi:hypothetical protein